MSQPMRRSSDRRDSWTVDEWWRQYGDAQLNSLMALALRDRLDVAVARTRIERATDRTLENEPSTAFFSLNPTKTIEPRSRDSIADYVAELDAWSRSRSVFAGATTEAEATRADTAHATRILTSSIALAYFEFDGLHALLADAVAALKDHERTRELFRVRLAHRLEMQDCSRRLESRVARTLEDMLSVDASLLRQRCVLAALTGEAAATQRALLRPAIAIGACQRLPYSIPLDLIGRRPDLIANRLLVEATSTHIGSASACFYPNINMSSLIGHQPLGLGQLSQERSAPGGYGLARSLPIHDRVRLSTESTSIPDAHDTAIDAYRASLVNALNEVADTAQVQLELDTQIASAYAALPSHREAVISTQDRYCASTANCLEVLASQDILHARRRELLELQIRRLCLDARMAHALGGGFDAAWRPNLR